MIIVERKGLDLIVKIDVDGVIRDIMSAMCDLYNSEFNCCMLPEEIVDYDINLFFPKIREKYDILPTEYFFRMNADKVFNTKVSPFCGVANSIKRLRIEGVKVIVVTWQFTKENIIHTLDFLENFGIEYDDICFTRDKWLIRGDYLIDDNPEFICDKRDRSKKIIVSTSYNKNVKCKLRVDSLEEAVDLILSNNLKRKVA